jgi:hypothetical protein
VGVARLGTSGDSRYGRCGGDDWGQLSGHARRSAEPTRCFARGGFERRNDEQTGRLTAPRARMNESNGASASSQKNSLTSSCRLGRNPGSHPTSSSCSAQESSRESGGQIRRSFAPINDPRRSCPLCCRPHWSALPSICQDRPSRA